MICGLYAPYIKGGAEVVAETLAKGLRERGHEVRVVTTYDGDRLENAEIDGIEIRRYGIKNSYWHFNHDKPSAVSRMQWHVRDIYNFSAGNDIKATALDFKPDIAVCHNLAGFSISPWKILADMNIPVVQILHDYYLLCPRSALFKAGANCENRCLNCRLFRVGHPFASHYLTGVISVSKATLKIHELYGMFQSVPIKRVVYNAHSLNYRVRENRGNPAAVIGFIGALSPEKGVQILITEFKKAAVQFPDARLLIAGAGETGFVQQLKDAANGFNIEFLGRVDAMEFYNRIDVCVVPSIWLEPLGLVAIEALANGVPVIGANAGGIPEIVKDRYNGLVYDPKSEDGLFNALSELMQSGELMAKLSSVAVGSVQDFVNEAKMVDEHEAIYKESIEVFNANR